MNRRGAMLSLLAAAWITGCFAPCSGDNGCLPEHEGTLEGTRPCADAEAKWRECHLDRSTPSPCASYEETAVCKADCATKATCDEIVQSAKNGAYARCLAFCDGYFICASNGLIEPKQSVCNDFADCEDGSDEQGCPSGPVFW